MGAKVEDAEQLKVLRGSHMSLLPDLICHSKSPSQPRFKRQRNNCYLHGRTCKEVVAAGGVMDVNTALQEALKAALIHDGLARSIRKAAKALDKRQDYLGVLASNCDEPVSVKSVEAFCAEHKIHLIKVGDNKKLGEWVCLCKIDREENPRKWVVCSCLVFKDSSRVSGEGCIKEYFTCKK
ncbi:PREDICTED: 40S ribosomal protein S12-like [Hipposideros armiger]|uniref:40S ribosomal protein S12 n=1 Tax=Hipposideros armiger TaxID=186990 RepID=A0A8B7SB34_HIPAR|nr:PREDICTED: 40S ribosomal protein S12-like [Hipposideros armiger]